MYGSPSRCARVGVSVVRGRLPGASDEGWPSSSQQIWPRVPTGKPSSGTTGEPKGCMLSHGNMYFKCRVYTDLHGWTSADRYLVPVPYFHIFGSMGGIDTFTEKALGILTSSALADALDLSQEDPAVVARYGVDDPAFERDGAPRMVRNFCIARRLVEAGARVVTLNFMGR